MSYTPAVEHTASGTPYLREPGVTLVAWSSMSTSGMADFLTGLDPRFEGYVHDNDLAYQPGSKLAKVAGQLCYLSFGETRTPDHQGKAYLQHILESGHGSVLEHASYTFLLYGVSRSFTHELVRHRAGFAYSQVSQRYVGGKHLRFVERPEFTHNPVLHDLFLNRIDGVQREYERLQDILEGEMARSVDETQSDKTTRRKAVRQAARACLTNETEAPILVTANARAWRHFLTMRGSVAAEPEIRRVALTLLEELTCLDYFLFQDFHAKESLDGVGQIVCDWPKV